MEKGQDQSPGETFLMTKKKMKKGVSKDLSAETFWGGKREIIPEKDIFISAHIIEVELKKKFCSG